MTQISEADTSAPTGVSRVRPWLVPGALLVILVWMYLSWARDWWTIAIGGFDGWGTGEWLLSYDGGFVRRGLAGSLILELTPSDWSIVSVATGVQIVLMGLVFALMYILYLRTDRSPAWAMLILSPAVLLHPITAITWQSAGPRKELLVFVALGLVALGYWRKHWLWWGVGGLAVFVLATWSHEASALMLPAFVYLIWKGSEASPAPLARNLLVAAYSFVAALAVVLAVLFPGDAAIQQAVCQAWAERGVAAACDGEALGALTLTPAAALEWFGTQLFPRYWGYLPVAALAAVPLFAVRFLPRYWRPAVVLLVAMAPLFYIAWDYGRWIYMAAVAMSFMAMAVASTPGGPRPMKVPIIAVVAYCLLWAFPGYSNESPVMYEGLLVKWLAEHYPTAWF